jgi:tetratricopeptide (TPR) repeat protein
VGRAKDIAGRILQKGESLEARILLALIMAKERGPEAALEGLKELRRSPEEEYRLLTAQCAVTRMSDAAAALSYCDRATEMNADDFWAWFNKGLIYEEREDFEKATKAYQEAVRINPSHAQARNNLGYSYKERHFYAYAIEHYGKAIELMPDNPGFYYNIGNAYAHKDRVDEAFAAYRKALDLDPSFSKAHYNMARMYLRKDMVKEAISEFRLYLRYATKAVYAMVASKSSVENEIEELEEYLSSYGEVRVQREGMAK